MRFIPHDPLLIWWGKHDHDTTSLFLLAIRPCRHIHSSVPQADHPPRVFNISHFPFKRPTWHFFYDVRGQLTAQLHAHTRASVKSMLTENMLRNITVVAMVTHACVFTVEKLQKVHILVDVSMHTSAAHNASPFKCYIDFHIAHNTSHLLL